MNPCPVDISRINEFTDGDPEQFRELTALYLDQCGGQLRELDAAVQAGDAEKVEHLAHKSAGSSATCGMVLITPFLRDLEQKAREGDLSQAASLFVEIQREFEKIQAFLAEHQP